MKSRVITLLLTLITVVAVFNIRTRCFAEELSVSPSPPSPINEPPISGTPTSHWLKIMTYNIHHGTDVNGIFDLEGVVETIRQSDADIIALQEVDRVWGGRSLYYDEPRFIAEQLSMNYAFEATIIQNPFHPGSGEYGIMILSKFPIIGHSFHELPGILEQRGILLCLIQTPEWLIPVACTHLGLSALDWEIQITDILNWLPKEDDLLLLGDFNTVAGPNGFTQFEGRLVDLQRQCGLDDSGTYLFGENWVRIDYIFAGNRWRPGNCQVIPGQSSDHLPVYIEIELVINEQTTSTNIPAAISDTNLGSYGS